MSRATCQPGLGSLARAAACVAWFERTQ